MQKVAKCWLNNKFTFRAPYITSTTVFDMHLINEIDCYFSSLKVIFDIDFFGAGLLFIFICISTSFLFNIRLFR